MIIPINLGEKSYDIVVSEGALQSAGELIDLNRKVLIVTDDGVPEEYAKTVLRGCKEGYIITVKSGEESKSVATYEMLLKEMLRHRFKRNDCVVAVGGGVVGDLAGFVAASYMRGVDFYNIPTTLLSQVDSSIGGKVAINLGEIKNIVGAFYQPKKVIIDPSVLKSLSHRQLLSGLAESIKMAMTYDSELFQKIEQNGIYDITDIIVRSLKIKKHFVENDEKENGIRKVLNFGHTIGHAIESAAEFTLYHGECVALGMLYMCHGDVKERLVSLLSKVGLPTTHNYKNLYDTVIHDKKGKGGNITVVYVEKIGEYTLRTVSREEIKKYIG